MKHGGKAIASGGYGCVFKPPIKCIDEEKRARQMSGNYVSKLMDKGDMEMEMREIVGVKEVVNKIPNNSLYFLVDSIFTCNPNVLNEEDMKDYDIKCNAKYLEDVNAVNENIRELGKDSDFGIINVPFGGIELQRAILLINEGSESLYNREMNNLILSLHDLLKNAIVPMNELGLNHNDIKSQNILYDKKEDGSTYTRLIDWGLSINNNSILDENNIPENISGLPISFNAPFGVVLLNPRVIQLINNDIKKQNYNLTDDGIDLITQHQMVR